MNWTKLGLKVLKAIPIIQHTIQTAGHAAHGGDKKAAVLAAIQGSLDIAESVTDKSILSDPRVIAVLGKANDIAVEVQNVIAQVTAEHRSTN